MHHAAPVRKRDGKGLKTAGTPPEGNAKPRRTGGGRRGRGEPPAPPAPQLKPLAALLDKEPLLNEEMLRLALWLKEHTFCTYFDALRVLL
ncbi:hypothetical protein, partial [uncultured Oscillibacter sp.]|uniref:primosomal protein N' family DNA-binding protein n=1 Tax=uncultured Oscillibacter sp. TaxID=876091 RepID=UPI003456F914